ncbi:MAG: T9SS type A sorting domain-containing protein [bacterium]
MMKRTDALWARVVPAGTVTVDGKLTESAWAKAESTVIRYDPSNSNNIPGSGWKSERSGGSWNGTVTDPTRAVIKFLIQGDELILGVFVSDSSVGGGLFNECDGLLMNLRDHASPNLPAPPFEYGYAWVTETWGDPNAGNVNASPIYFGPVKSDRSIYTGATQVLGVSNDDKNGGTSITADQGYTMEIRFNLPARGYNVNKPGGEIIEFTLSVYDADWQWPYNDSKFYGNRVWWQGQWGNSDTWNVGRIYVRQDVTISTTSLPVIGPDLIIPNGKNHPAPTIDGNLTEGVWKKASSFRITFNDSTLRKSYPGVGPWRSGQTQPVLTGAIGTPPVLDPGDAVFKYFFIADTLYLGIDVNDQVVTSIEDYDRWDAVRLMISSRDSLEKIDHVLLTRMLTVRFDNMGKIQLRDYLQYLDSLKYARAALKMKSGTTINDPTDADAGYTIEMAIALSPFGYPAGRGDGVLFLGATLMDGDKFSNAADDYGTRAWFMREHDRSSAPAWCYMDPNSVITSVVEETSVSPVREFRLLGNYPNPFNPSTTILYEIPDEGLVTLIIYDALGRIVEKSNAGYQNTGTHSLLFHGQALSSGIYFYHLELQNVRSTTLVRTSPGKMILVK